MHGTIVEVERKKRETWVGSGRVGSGRVGSGRVGSGERCFLSDWTLTSLFFHTVVTIAPFIGHFV